MLRFYVVEFKCRQSSCPGRPRYTVDLKSGTLWSILLIQPSTSIDGVAQVHSWFIKWFDWQRKSRTSQNLGLRFVSSDFQSSGQASSIASLSPTEHPWWYICKNFLRMFFFFLPICFSLKKYSKKSAAKVLFCIRIWLCILIVNHFDAFNRSNEIRRY